MSGFTDNRSQLRQNYTSDPPLIKLVEEFLCDNSHRSFINLEEMGEIIRKKSFKFRRMKQSTFKQLLKTAYNQYYNSANEDVDEVSGNNIEQDNTPLTSETFNQMDGFPLDSEGDTDVDEVPLDDTGSDQMKDLYLPTSTEGSNLASSNGNALSVEEHVEIGSSTVLEPQGSLNNLAATDNSKNSTSTDPPKNSVVVSNQSLETLDLNVSGGGASTEKEDNNDSGSDLEIIDEVPNDHFALASFPNGGGMGVTQGWPQQLSSEHYARKAITVGSGGVSYATAQKGLYMTNSPASVICNKVTQGQGVANIPSVQRGVKRKLQGSNASSSKDDDDIHSKRLKKEVNVIYDTKYKLKDFAGSDKMIEEICKLLMHLKRPEIYLTLGVTPPRGFLLHGPPGTGKTLLANAIAGELEMPLLKVAGTELVSGISGESENNIRELFNQALSVAPCIIFIDEIDSVTPRRQNASKEMERRIVAQLLSCIDDLVNKEKGNQVLLIGATNRIEAMDTALRRAGRFDREICLGIPDEHSREKILSIICRDLKVSEDFQVGLLAKLTPGYVGADLQALVREAAVEAVNRMLVMENSEKLKPEATADDKQEQDKASAKDLETDDNNMETDTSIETDANVELKETAPVSKPEHLQTDPMKWIKGVMPLTPEDLKNLYLTMVDFELALKNVQPSSKREGFATVPDTTWDDIGALHNIRDELQVSILGPVKHAEAFGKLNLITPAGVLLCGPPGCGKTLLAKAVANEAGINFISVKGPELLNMYVGESERAVRQCFLRARNSSPCVIFFDELDALCPRRSDVADGGSSGRIVNQLLTEMDGVESRNGVFVMAATNRPDIIDPAVLRPGRLDKILFINLPTPKDRFDILKALTKNCTKPPMAEDVNLEEIANCPECENYTGADLAALIREASIASFRELVLQQVDTLCPADELKVYHRHFTTAFTKTKPSVGKEDRRKYKVLEEKYSSLR